MKKLYLFIFIFLLAFSSASKWDSGSIGKFDYVEPTSSGNETTITGDCPDGYAVQNITDGGIECIEMTGGTGSVSVNSTQFDSDNPIHIKTSWLTSFIESISKWGNYYDTTQIDNRYSNNTGDQSSSDFNLSDLNDVIDTSKATGKILQVNSDGNHEYVDLPDPDLSALVPYTGASTDVDLGANDLTADSLISNKHIYLPDTNDLSGVYGIIYKAGAPFIHNYHKIYATDGTTPLDGQNLFIGKDAGNFIMGDTATAAEHSSNNLGIGKEALKSLTTGYDNVGIGPLSSSKITTGRGNIYIGGNAGASTTTMSYNVGIGQNSVKSAISVGGNLVGVGYETLMSVNGGGSLSAFGTSAGASIVSGSHSSFFGFKSGYYTKGEACTFIGSEAGLGGSSTSSTGTLNTAVGFQALRSYTRGQRNTMIGQSSGYSISSGQRNTGVGSEVLYGLTTGSYNTAIGEGAGRYYSTGTSAHTTGTSSVFIGRLTRPLGNSQTNQIVIGASAVGKGSNTVTLGNDDITNTYLKGNVVMQDDNDKLYFGTDNDEYLEYDPTLDGIQTAGIFKASEVRAIHKATDGTSPVADGTYIMGLGGTTNGTITIKDGIITAIQEAVA